MKRAGFDPPSSSSEWRAALSRHALSSRKLHELGHGNIGAMFSVHVLLDAEGQEAPWLVKRLRCHLNDGESATALVRLFAMEHEQMEQYFGMRRSMIPTTYFVEGARPALEGEDREMDRPYEPVVVQRWIRGRSLKHVARHGPPSTAVVAELQRFVERYRRMQQDGIIPDLFQLASDHLMFDEQERLWLIDTNNLLRLDAVAPANPLFQAYRGDSTSMVSIDELHRVFSLIARDLSLDVKSCWSPVPWFDPVLVRPLIDLVRYFPTDGADNPYLAQLRQTFGL